MSPRSSYTVAVSSEPIIETQADLVEAINAITPESRVEAVLVTSDRPVREARLVEATGLNVVTNRSWEHQIWNIGHGNSDPLRSGESTHLTKSMKALNL